MSEIELYLLEYDRRRDEALHLAKQAANRMNLSRNRVTTMTNAIQDSKGES
jgi:hypothetical protein